MNSNAAIPTSFFGNSDPLALADRFGTPLYVYNETILRERCRELKNLIPYPHFVVNYSAKANSNLALLRIVCEEGLSVDAMSPGEIHVELQAGFDPANILYIGNNVSAEEMRYAVDAGVKVSVDSLSQLEKYGRINPGGDVAVRFNPGIGAGHHAKVITAGKKTKFGVMPEMIPRVKEILKTYKLRLAGINQHIGSLFMEDEAYLQSIDSLLEIAEQFPDLDFIDFGGGFGIPYHKQEGEGRLDLETLSQHLGAKLEAWVKGYGKQVTFKVEPGRYIAAECGALLGTVHSIKQNHGRTYVGTDIGFNVLIRPVLYHSHHDVLVFHRGAAPGGEAQEVTVVGNICETGDIIANNRLLPPLREDDVLCVLDAGAYGFVMSSNYNNRLRPAEVLITAAGEAKLVRRRDTLEDLTKQFVD